MSHIFTDVINHPAYNEKPLALVVAGTAEIGRNVINSLINDGYLVVFTWFSNEAVVSDMKARYQSAVMPVQLDLTSEHDVVQFCTALENIKVDVAIYCAGNNPACLCDELKPENIRTTTRLNYLSAVLIFNTIVKTMKQYKENETKLVFISSVAAKKNQRGQLAVWFDKSSNGKISLQRRSGNGQIQYQDAMPEPWLYQNKNAPGLLCERREKYRQYRKNDPNEKNAGY